jgi:chloramphenicol-sensitive protein RarD
LLMSELFWVYTSRLKRRPQRMNKGTWYALGAYITWGLFPIYWTLLAGIPALQLLGHRIFWSFLLLFGIVLVSRKGSVLRAALNWKVILIYSVAAVLIAINWLTYVWAVGAGFIVETSLGYFINPLLSVLLGVVFFRERLRPLQWLPIGLAAAGVLYLTFAYGSLPWVALTLAISFGLYGLVKKNAPLGALQGLTLETGILFLPALVFLLASEFTGTGAFMHTTPLLDLMLVGAGLVTVAPLLMFAFAVQRIPLTMMGVLQYVNPTMQFLLGVLIFKEPINNHRLIGFGVIWLALILYGLEGFLVQRRSGARLRTAQSVRVDVD